MGISGSESGSVRGGAAPALAGCGEALSPGPLTVPKPRPKGTVSVAAPWPWAVTVPVALGCVVLRVHNEKVGTAETVIKRPAGVRGEFGWAS